MKGRTDPAALRAVPFSRRPKAGHSASPARGGAAKGGGGGRPAVPKEDNLLLSFGVGGRCQTNVFSEACCEACCVSLPPQHPSFGELSGCRSPLLTGRQSQPLWGPRTTPQARPVGARQPPLQGGQIKPGARAGAWRYWCTQETTPLVCWREPPPLAGKATSF